MTIRLKALVVTHHATADIALRQRSLSLLSCNSDRVVCSWQHIAHGSGIVDSSSCSSVCSKNQLKEKELCFYSLISVFNRTQLTFSTDVDLSPDLLSIIDEFIGIESRARRNDRFFSVGHDDRLIIDIIGRMQQW